MLESPLLSAAPPTIFTKLWIRSCPDPFLAMTSHEIPVAQVQRRKQESEEFLNLCKVMQPANVECLQRVPVCRLTFDQMALGDRTVSEGRKRAEGEGSICPRGSGGLRPLQQQECQTTLVDTVSFASHPRSCAYDYITDRAMSHVTGCAAMHVVEMCVRV